MVGANIPLDSLACSYYGRKAGGARDGGREKLTLALFGLPNAEIHFVYLPGSLFSRLQDTFRRLFSSLTGRFQCSQRSFTGGSIDTVLVSFRRSQAHCQVNSVRIIQGTLKDNGISLGHLQPGLVLPLRSSIEAACDDPVTLHDLYNGADFVTIDMTFLPT